MRRSGTITEPAGHGFTHDAALYDSDEALVELLVPFLRDGRSAGEPTLLSLDPRLQRMVADELGDLSGVTVLAGDGYGDPLETLREHHAMVRDLAAAGAGLVRLVGQVPRPGRGSRWEGWDRYEAVVNHLYADLPVWSVCPYDTRDLEAATLGDVERTHPTLWTRQRGRRPNARYTDPADFLAERARRLVDPLEREAPDVALTDPTLAAGRDAVASLAAASRLDAHAVEGLCLAVNEVVTNAVVHGHPPVRLCGWSAADRVVVTVRDGGSGPRDPFAGMLPPEDDDPTGRGLWVAHRVCSRVTMAREPDGFRVRLVAGTPHPPAGTA